MGNQKNQLYVTVDPPVHDPARAAYTPAEVKKPRLRGRDANANAEERREDHVYSVASRARWAEADISQLHRDSRQLEGAINASGEQEEEEEEEEEFSASDLTVAQLREALEAAGVEIPVGAKKADLVELYEEHDLGDTE